MAVTTPETTVGGETKIKLALVLILFGYGLGGAWWASSTDSRLASVEKSSDKQVILLERIESKVGDTNKTALLNSQEIAVMKAQIADLTRRTEAVEKR